MSYLALLALMGWICWVCSDRGSEASDTAVITSGLLMLGTFTLMPLWA